MRREKQFDFCFFTERLLKFSWLSFSPADNETYEQHFRREAFQHADEVDVLRTFRGWRRSSENRSDTREVSEFIT